MITDKTLGLIIKVVADEAWGIAYKGDAPAAVCLLIEELSDDETVCSELVGAIRRKVDLGGEK